MSLFGRLRDRSQWPTTLASIDEVGVGVDKAGPKVEFSGAFTANGEYYSVMGERGFRSLRDAEAWAAMLGESRTLTVRYNPDDPSDNVVEDSSSRS